MSDERPIEPATPLSDVDHARDRVGLEYVYPVVSRRSGGVSVGVNLNPNRACNWRCVYCQVPDLVHGVAPEIDVALLGRQLRAMLDTVADPAWMERIVPDGARRLRDVAISGDGEPTTSRQLVEVVEEIGAALAERDLLGDVPLVLITNGSGLVRDDARRALERLAELGGEVWFKLDSATAEGARRINEDRAGPDRALENLRQSAARCPTWVQTCLFALDGEPPAREECAAYAAALAALLREGVRIAGVQLYGLARPSRQPEAPRLERLEPGVLEACARGLGELGLSVRVLP